MKIQKLLKNRLTKNNNKKLKFRNKEMILLNLREVKYHKIKKLKAQINEINLSLMFIRMQIKKIINKSTIFACLFILYYFSYKLY